MTKNVGLNRLLRTPHEEIAYHMGANLTGFTVRFKEDSVLLVVKIQKRMDGHQVAFIEAKTLLDCFGYLADHLNTTRAPLKFRPDKWANG